MTAVVAANVPVNNVGMMMNGVSLVYVHCDKAMMYMVWNSREYDIVSVWHSCIGMLSAGNDDGGTLRPS